MQSAPDDEELDSLSIRLVGLDENYPVRLNWNDLGVQFSKQSIVVPGDRLTRSREFIPGHGTLRRTVEAGSGNASFAAGRRQKQNDDNAEDNDEDDEDEDEEGAWELAASVAGRQHVVNKLLCVLPGRSRYAGEIGDVVVGRVQEVASRRWRIDANARLQATLHLSGVLLPGEDLRRKSEEDERAMRAVLAEGDLVSAEVQSVQADGSLVLHTRNARYGRLGQGTLVRVPPALIKRSKTHFHSLPCGVTLVLGMNGYCWCGPTPGQSDVREPLASPADRSEVARVRACVRLLAVNHVPLYDTSVMQAYEVARESPVALLSRPDEQLRVARLVAEQLLTAEVGEAQPGGGGFGLHSGDLISGGAFIRLHLSGGEMPGPGANAGLTEQPGKQPRQHRCSLCQSLPNFPSAERFAHHLRSAHLTIEGGSYLCRYGPNSVCRYQPMEGVSERDYELHVLRHHATGGATTSGGGVPDCVHTYREVRDGVTPGERWTPLHSVVNLPAVLNDPRRHRQASDVFSRTWGDAFERAEAPPSSLLPVIGRRDFERYLAKVAGPAKVRTRPDETPTAASAAPSTPSMTARLAQVESLFFQPEFDIRQKEVFSQVLPWQALQSGSSGGWRQLQEHLTQQLDVVEEAIAGQVSRKSHALFQTAASQDDIRTRLDGAVQSVRQFRQRLAGARQASSSSQLLVLRCWRRRRNCVAALERLELLLSVRATQPTIQQLLAATDYCGALDLMNSAQEALGQQLRGLHCCRHLHSQLVELRKFVGQMVESELVSALAKQLKTGQGAEALGPCALGMLRYGRSLHDCAAVLKREAFEHLRLLVRGCVQSAVQQQPAGSGSSSSGGEELTLMDQMRQLDFDPWLSMLESVCTSLHSALLHFAQAVTAVRTILGPLCSMLEAEQMLVDVRQNAQEKAVKLLAARSKDAFLERLSPAEFVRLSALVGAFADQLDGISLRSVVDNDASNGGEIENGSVVDEPTTNGGEAKPATAAAAAAAAATKTAGQSGSALLRSALHNQALRLVGRFHAERKTSLSLLLDNERWKPADVPAEFQLLASAIGEGRLDALASSSGSATYASAQSPSAASSIELCGEHFRVSSATLMLPLTCGTCAAREVFGHLVELLKHFNSRCCQLVLGAGAIQLVGLKTITTKNLCLAQRSLQLVLAILPHVTNHFVSRLGLPAVCQRALLDTAKDYGDHSAEISRKLVELMDSKAKQQLAVWQFRPPSPSVHIRSVVQAHCKLHENMAELLPRQQVTEIFLRLHNSFKEDFRRKLRECGVTNDRSPQHLHASTDMAFYLDSLRALRGLENFNDDFSDLWK
uniref:Vacuolar protein sorting-associated protein 54 n=1 Tax=Macrostomum lignano TaxID=282301 RepID=A0A1I8GFH4_9PLAT